MSQPYATDRPPAGATKGVKTMMNGQAGTTRTAACKAGEIAAVEELVDAAAVACEWALLIGSALQHHIECRHEPEVGALLLDAVAQQLARVRSELNHALHEVAAACARVTE